MLRKTFAALGVAAITLLASPMAANAAPVDPAECDDNYAQAGPVSSDVAVVDATGDGTVTVTWGDGYFMPGAAVDVAMSGPGSAGSELVTSGSTASGTGSMWATVTVADAASGALTVTGASTCATGGVTVEVAGSDDTAAVADDGLADDELAATGSSLPVVLIIAGGGALAFGAILLIARSRGRGRMQE